MPEGDRRRLEVVVSPLVPEDWPDVRRIHEEGIATGVATLDPESPDWATWNAGHRPDGRSVARVDGVVVGWVALSPYSSRPVYSGVAWESVYVSEAARGAGVGTRLLAQLVADAEAGGVWTLLAGVLADNVPSLALHRRLGFREIGVNRRLGRGRDGRWRDVVLLERRSEVVGAD